MEDMKLQSLDLDVQLCRRAYCELVSQTIRSFGVYAAAESLERLGKFPAGELRGEEALGRYTKLLRRGLRR
jgi:hypothetical protein